ncbi:MULTISPECIES: IS200/IS605 family element RNA-guided endonuclease TnpB [unclassified Microcoleus]|uniref:IS200/IS605 family element RNA-guided endonuclease TnpB n=1 Tax=unclassified Microcoleus TaxID=2642155 RepID=UPI001DCAF835|nr:MULTISPECIES: IS200/IS605 family element RNA-guided endonuclease TnpB [unclassified Microcoleus]MCC3431612.1 transposase [Microcoleus sp. PH2017_04_SCI_O_A]MCC3465801.1 transposase [Microcoleus sp. PH2017_06_SFM_O_A]MCC3502524.1 transposase [Microcoleus sp. PH2017_19_SFW_U_A]TAE12434.1 MAG: transposase [Oscillatoriales cyanobacterium]MCC3412991.1 transposase [Microcoleus sp. PH2017_02_FOX_O_A]
MLKAFKYRIYPTSEQSVLLAKSFGCTRWFYNYALNLTSETYKQTGKGLSRNEIIKLLPSLKKEYEWLAEAPSQVLQQAALNLSSAFLNFFEGRAKYPNFKKKQNRQSIRFPQGCELKDDTLKLPKIGDVRCKVSRQPEGTLKSVTVSVNPSGEYLAACLYDNGKDLPEKSTEGKAIGIDVGLTHYAVTSDGTKHGNPKYYRKYEKKLAKRQKQLSHKLKGSGNRNKARVKVAKVHAKIVRCREDFLHKLSRKLVDENQVIVVENLAVGNMVKNHKLAKSISDAGWGQFCTMLKYKAQWAGKTYVEVDRFYPSSKTCNKCLSRVDSLSLDVRSWQCPKCGENHDRDINAAKNILYEGLRILTAGHTVTASGGRVRPSKGTAFTRHLPVNEES